MRLRLDNRSVSEVLGYIFVFSIVLTSIGALYASGVGQVGDYRDNEQINNADRAFVALASNFEDLHRGRAPSQGGEIRLAGGQLSVDDSSSITVEVYDGGTVKSATIAEGALTYYYQGTEVRYDGGAVFRVSDGWSTNTRVPEMRCSEDQVVMSAVSLVTTGNQSIISKPGTVFVVGTRESTTVVYPPADQVNSGLKTVNLTVSSPAGEGWNETLTQNGWSATGSGQYSCTNVKQVLVRDTTIGIRILP